MPRKRRPFVIAGETVDLLAPGLDIRDRGGRSDPYWVASKDARSRGYLPRTVHLHYPLTFTMTRAAIIVDGLRSELDNLAARCRTLTAEMLDWIDDPEAKNKPIYDGTLKSLIDCYQRDPESGYASLGHNTQICYSDLL